MITITPRISVKESEIKFSFVTSPGPGGQNVNKVATAVQLRFDVLHSPSLPEDVRIRLMNILGRKITTRGEFIIKASRFRTQERNKQDALNRFIEILRRAITPPKKRKKTRPTVGSIERRLTKKKLHGAKKSMRRSTDES